jgi:hypothetical protein
MHSRRGRRLCCSLGGIEMLQREKYIYFIYLFFQKKFQVLRDPRIAVGDDNYATTSVRLKCFKDIHFKFFL